MYVLLFFSQFSKTISFSILLTMWLLSTSQAIPFYYYIYNFGTNSTIICYTKSCLNCTLNIWTSFLRYWFPLPFSYEHMYFKLFSSFVAPSLAQFLSFNKVIFVGCILLHPKVLILLHIFVNLLTWSIPLDQKKINGKNKKVQLHKVKREADESSDSI